MTNEGLAHLRGIHTLEMENCWRVTDAGLVHLRGIRQLTPPQYASQLTPAGLAQLEGAVIRREGKAEKANAD